MVAMRDVVAAVGALGLALATLINACGGGRSAIESKKPLS
jgi:hypothetical protein